jgi:uncharacterized delta-60 repeat protein
LAKEIQTMSFSTARKTPFAHSPRRHLPFRPRLEELEDRCLLSGPGSLDTTFGSGGLVTTSFTVKPHDTANSVAVQTDGKIIAAGIGYTNSGKSTTYAFEVARYNTAGSLDTTFGSGGLVSTAITGQYDWGFTLQPDGKIVVGTSTGSAGAGQYELARYNTNGALDTTFGPSQNGTLFTNFGSGVNLVLQGLTVETVGGIPKLVAAVRWVNSSATSQQTFALARYNLDGSLDSTFGTSGEVVTPRTTFYASKPLCVTAQADGKILVGGWGAYTYVGENPQFVVARYDTSGNLDPSFGTGGYAVVSSSQWGEVDAFVVQPDGKIIAGGLLGGAGTNALARLNVGVAGQADGSLDSTFGSGGTAADSNDPTGLVIQTNGKIVSAGGSTLYRYNPDGSLDTGFGTAGGVSMPSSSSVNGVALQNDGKILAAGATAASRNLTYSFAVARFLGDPVSAPAVAVLSAAIDAIFADMRAVAILLSADSSAKKH